MKNIRLRHAVEALAEKFLGKHGIVAIDGEETIVVMVEGDAAEATKVVPLWPDGVRAKIVSTEGFELHRKTQTEEPSRPKATVLEGLLRIRDWPISPNPSLWLEHRGCSMSASAVLSGSGGDLIGRRVRVTIEAIDEEGKPTPPGGATLELLVRPFEVDHMCPECGSAMHKPVSLWRCTKDQSHTMVGPEIAFEMRTRTENSDNEEKEETKTP